MRNSFTNQTALDKCRIYVDTMTISCQFSLLTWNPFIEQLVHPVGRESKGGKGGKIVESLYKPAACFILLENMNIWCNIQVIIYPLLLFPCCYLHKLLAWKTPMDNWQW